MDPVLHSPEKARLDGEAFAQVLDALRERSGLDFRGYRRATVERRVRVRMISVGADTCSDYLALLRADGEEAARLIERITIKVSSFLRNPEAFETLQRAAAARALAVGRPLSVWSAGCAYGEEPYSLAMQFAAAGLAVDRILATDVDPSTLARARESAFPVASVERLPEAWRTRFFEPAVQGTVRVRRELRERVRWMEHDLACGLPPAVGFDLVCCRNTLIYFSRPLQERALDLLGESLEEGGLLWLGEAEWMSGERMACYEVVDRQARLFRRRSGKERE